MIILPPLVCFRALHPIPFSHSHPLTLCQTFSFKQRLPRRILVDLPTSADRLAILNLHLSAENLALDVNLEDIASDAKTNLYSGSDLKNLAVAAALSCVREENDKFKETGTYPDKRTLEQRHFDKALNEISASISEDMGSLVQIRKFDEKYVLFSLIRTSSPPLQLLFFVLQTERKEEIVALLSTFSLFLYLPPLYLLPSFSLFGLV